MTDVMVDAALPHLRAGGVLCYETETSYAIGCDATNARAVRAIFLLKDRERGKPFPLIVASRAMAERWATVTPLAQRLARRCWPGPFTFVLRARRRLGRGVVAQNGTIALRVPAHPIARALARRLGRPIVATSANRSGDPPARSVRAARRAFPDVPILGSRTLPRRLPSTIVDCTSKRPRVLRTGAMRIPASWIS